MSLDLGGRRGRGHSVGRSHHRGCSLRPDRRPVRGRLCALPSERGSRAFGCYRSCGRDGFTTLSAVVHRQGGRSWITAVAARHAGALIRPGSFRRRKHLVRRSAFIPRQVQFGAGERDCRQRAGLTRNSLDGWLGRQRAALAGIGGIEQFHLDLGVSLAHVAQLAGRQVGQVDQPPTQERPPIVDAHDHRTAVVQARDARVAGQRQRRVSSRHLVHVVGFARGCGLAVKALPIPGRHALLLVGLAFGHGCKVLPHHPIGAVGPGQQRFVLRYGVGLAHQAGHPLRIRLAGAVIQVVAAPARRVAAGAACGQAAQQGRGTHRHPPARAVLHCRHSFDTPRNLPVRQWRGLSAPPVPDGGISP